MCWSRWSVAVLASWSSPSSWVFCSSISGVKLRTTTTTLTGGSHTAHPVENMSACLLWFAGRLLAWSVLCVLAAADSVSSASSGSTLGLWGSGFPGLWSCWSLLLLSSHTSPYYWYASWCDFWPESMKTFAIVAIKKKQKTNHISSILRGLIIHSIVFTVTVVLSNKTLDLTASVGTTVPVVQHCQETPDGARLDVLVGVSL